MKIRMRSLAAGATGVFREGTVYTSPGDLSDAQAQQFVEAGYAVIVAESPAATPPAESLETATPPAESEQAIKSRPPKAKG